MDYSNFLTTFPNIKLSHTEQIHLTKLQTTLALHCSHDNSGKKLHTHKRFQIDENNSGDLKLLIQRWTKSKTSRPTWKVIKLFMNEDLLPEDNLVYQLFPDISGKEQYLTFRRKIFSAYFITNLFDSLDDHGFLDPYSKEMIQNRIRLFYRHFLVTKEPALSQEETHNPMFCMLYRFLLKDDMGYDFNTDNIFSFVILVLAWDF